MATPFIILETGLFAKIVIPPFDVTRSGALTFHFLKLKNNSGWNLDGYLDNSLHSLPQIPSNHQGVGAFEYSNTLPSAMENYKTVIATRFYGHDQSVDFTCRVRITFQGIIRNSYLNSEYILSGSSIDPQVPVILESSQKVSFISLNSNMKRLFDIVSLRPFYHNNLGSYHSSLTINRKAI